MIRPAVSPTSPPSPTAPPLAVNQGDDELGLVPEVEFEEDELDFPPLNSRKLLACRTKIGIKNKTGSTIYFYLRYRDGGPNQWITSEEFSVKPNSYNRPVTTDNSIWYYYAYR